MDVLYIATQGENATTLSIDLEISKLERLFSTSSARFNSIASIRAEELSQELGRRKFDVLHITAHGEGNALQALTNRGGTVLASPQQLAAFILPRQRPRLIYLNACDSDPVAQELVMGNGVQFAIGNTAPVASDYSIHGALAFYSRILLGASLSEAENVARQMVEMLSSNRSSVKIHSAKKADATAEFLMPEPEIYAALPEGDYGKSRNWVEVLFGIRGAPAGTRQVIFFSDDNSLIESKKNL